MKTPKGYTTKEAVENYSTTDIIEEFSEQIEEFIAEMEDYVDDYTKRNFVADSTATTRLYNGNGSKNLPIDDCIEITKVERGTNTYGDDFIEIEEGGSGGYYLLPANYEEEELPINKIHLRSMYWNEGLNNHRITAKWGYSEEAPADIKFATTVLVNGVIKENNTTKGDIERESIGEYSVAFKDQKEKSDYKRAMEILDNYKKFNL